MDPATWAAFAAASAVLLIIPGPTILLVMGYALSQGRRVAVSSALGVALGDLLAMTASLAGLGALVLASATAFTVLKWVGAVYLFWLGWRMWRGAGAARLGHVAPEDKPEDKPERAIFAHAALVTALNPKSIAFFIAFAPQFVDATAPLWPQFAVMIATFVGLAGLNALAFALLADRLRSGLKRPAVLQWITRGGAAALMAMAAATALTRRPV